MKNTILYFALLFSFYQCNSQKKENEMKPILEKSFTKITNPQYFIGNWYNTQTYYLQNGERKLQALRNCDGKSYWKFQEEKGLLKQSKFTAKGKNCDEFVSTTLGRVNFTDFDMQYFVDDVLYAVKVNIISEQKFSLITTDVIAGKKVEIEKIYEKK
jgi:hypothetical protein